MPEQSRVTSPGSTVADPAATAGKTLPPALLKAMTRVTELSSLPEVTARIITVAENPEATASDMHEVVKSDPALAAKLLKVVNSAFYGLPSQIASLERAILMLGLSVVKNLALATSLTRLLKAERIAEPFGPRDLWRHCVSVAVCARMVARHARLPQPDEAFVAGLVHDMGLMVEQQLFAAKLGEVATRCHAAPQNFCAAEETAVGADHQAIGSVLAMRWKFPPGLRHAIAYHHEPSSLQPEFQKLATVVYVADTLCCHGRHGFWLTAQTQEISDWMLQLLGLTSERMGEITESLPEMLEEAEGIFSDL